MSQNQRLLPLLILLSLPRASSKHHYPNGRSNCLVGRENFQSNDEQVVGQKMDEWHANFPVRAAHKWNYCLGEVFTTIAFAGGHDAI